MINATGKTQYISCTEAVKKTLGIKEAKETKYITCTESVKILVRSPEIQDFREIKKNSIDLSKSKECNML